MMHQVLKRRLDNLAGRYRLLSIWRRLATVWLAAAIVGGLLWIWKRQSDVPTTGPMIAIGLGALVLAVVAIWRGARAARDYGWVAQQIEAAYPELRTCLLAAVEQTPDATTGEFGYLQSRVIRQALDHARRHSWSRIIPVQKLVTSAAICALAFTLFSASLAGALLTSTAQSNLTTVAAVEPSTPTGPEVVMSVEPGDAEVERGTSLLVLARIQGPMPAEATLEYQFTDGQASSQTMPPSLADPVLSGRIPLVEQPLEYQVKLARRPGVAALQGHRVRVSAAGTGRRAPRLSHVHRPGRAAGARRAHSVGGGRNAAHAALLSEQADGLGHAGELQERRQR